MFRASTLFVAAVAVMVAVALHAVTASAHARPKSSTPAKGEVLAASPPRVDIYFTQAVQKIAGTYGIEVERDRGGSVAAGSAVIDESDRSHVSVALQPGLKPGRYVVRWKNVSDDDGDPAEGAFSFYVQTQPNAVDRENDAQIEQIGAEGETPSPAGTAAPQSSAAGSPSAAATRPALTAAAPTPAPAASSDDDRDSNMLYIVGAAIVAGVIAGMGGWWLVRRNRA
ncbi:MAG: copper resistance protein CopC [Chloroflexi bacterium]|nr:copper resistance protein CopC [Chloroflexota bacterium]